MSWMIIKEKKKTKSNTGTCYYITFYHSYLFNSCQYCINNRYTSFQVETWKYFSNCIKNYLRMKSVVKLKCMTLIQNWVFLKKTVSKPQGCSFSWICFFFSNLSSLPLKEEHSQFSTVFEILKQTVAASSFLT